MATPLRHWPDITWESIALNEAQDRRSEHRRYINSVTPSQAQNLADLSFSYPGMSPGVATGLALAGVRPFSNEAETIDARDEALTAAGLNAPPRKPGFWDMGLGREVMDFARGAFLLFEGLYDEVVKGSTSTIYNLGQQLNQGRNWGNLDFAEAGRGSFGMSPWALERALRDQGYNISAEGLFSEGVITPQTQALIEQGVPFLQAIQNPAQFEVGVPLRQFSEAVKQRSGRKIAGSTDVVDERTGQPGLLVTPGRVVASWFTEPGTDAYNHLSGITDFAANIFLDPANKVPFKFAEDIKGLNRALVGNGARKTVLARNVDDWLRSSHGTRVAQYIADTDDYLTLHGLFRHSTRDSVIDSNFIAALTDTTDPNDVKNLISRLAKGGDIERGILKELPVKQSLIGRATSSSGIAGAVARVTGAGGGAIDVGGLRHAIRANRQSTSFLQRMGAEVGIRALRVDDISGSVDDFGQWMKAAGFTTEEMSGYMGRMARMQNGGIENATVMWGIVSDAYRDLGNKMVTDGISPHVAKAFTQAFDTISDYRKFWIDNMGDPVMFAGGKYKMMVNGQLVALPSAQLFSEFMDWSVPLLDMRRIRKGLRRAKWAKAGFEDLANAKISAKLTPGKFLPSFSIDKISTWDDLGPSVIGSLVNSAVQDVWKPLVLLRVAWPVRVIAEEQVRMMAAGLDGIWNHPLHSIMHSFGRRLGTDVLETPFEDARVFRSAMSKRGLEFGLGTQRSLFTSEWLKVDISDPRYWDGLAIELQQLAEDPIVKRIANAVLEADPSTPLTDILKPIKDEFAGVVEGPLTPYRDILAADSQNWRLIGTDEGSRFLADAVIDDRFARLVHKTGGDVVRADHVRGEWTDLWGNRLTFDPNTGSYRAPNGMTYDLPEIPDIDVDFSAKGFSIDLNDPNLDPATRKALTPSGRADLGPLDLIEMAGTPEARRARFAGYTPTEGMPTLDEIANKAGWTPTELKDMFGADAFMFEWKPQYLDPLTLDTIPVHKLDADGTAVRIFTEPGQPPIPNQNYGETIYIAHDNWVTGQLEVVYGPDGRVVDIGALRVSKGIDPNEIRSKLGLAGTVDIPMPLAKAKGFGTDSADLMAYATRNFEAGDYQSMMDMAFGGVPVRDWLTSAGLSEYVIGDQAVLSINELAEFLRQQYGAGWSDAAVGPLGRLPAIQLTNDGARSLAAGLVRSAKGRTRFLPDEAAKAQAWPQRHMLSQVVRDPDSDLLAAVASGKLGDLTLATQDLLDDAEKVARVAKLGETLRGGWADATDRLPQYTKVARQADEKRLRTAVDHMFDFLMSRPTNKLSRAPAFKQFYWKYLSEMYPYMDDATRAAALKGAKAAGIGKGDLASMLKAALSGEDVTEVAFRKMADDLVNLAKSGPGDITDLAEADKIAKAFALGETKQLLYDLTKKTQFFDITRNVFPFGEAWYEIITTWLRLFSENPHLIRRLQQGLEGARQEGIFYPDPSTGEEVFAMPHLDFLGQLMGISEEPDSEGPQARPQFTGRVEGVNLLLNNFLPGVGPVIQMPAASFATDLLDKPEMRWARDLIFPYGYQDASTPGALANSLMPAWFRKALTAMGRPTGDDQRLYNNTVIDVLRAMHLNGEIGTNMTPGDMGKLLEEARSRARKIYTLRFIQQFIGPTGAQVRWDVEVDPEGEAYSYQVLSTEYRRMIDLADGDRVQAFYQFVNRFGFDPAAIATAKTESLRPRTVTERGLDFQQANPELFDDFKLTAYYAAPDGPDEEFSYSAYLAQIREGERVGLTPEQWEIERNRMLGSVAYERLRRRAVATGTRNRPEVAAYLRAIRYHYMEVYPGYGFENIGVVRQPDQRQFMVEFDRWRTDPKLSQTLAGQGLSRYLAARDRALALAAGEYKVSEEGFATAKATAVLREYLLDLGVNLTRRYPDFGVIFQRHYLWEVEAPEAEAPAGLMGVDLSGGT